MKVGRYYTSAAHYRDRQFASPMETPVRWLARLAMSFFVFAAVLAWEAYKAGQRHAEPWRTGLYDFAAAAAIALGLAGTRERHRRAD